eukprot:8137096-Pyramimonas_sp.AAC.1
MSGEKGGNKERKRRATGGSWKSDWLSWTANAGQLAEISGGSGEEKLAAVERMVSSCVRDMMGEDVDANAPLMAAGVVRNLQMFCVPSTAVGDPYQLQPAELSAEGGSGPLPSGVFFYRSGGSPTQADPEQGGTTMSPSRSRTFAVVDANRDMEET